MGVLKWICGLALSMLGHHHTVALASFSLNSLFLFTDYFKKVTHPDLRNPSDQNFRFRKLINRIIEKLELRSSCISVTQIKPSKLSSEMSKKHTIELGMISIMLNCSFDIGRGQNLAGGVSSLTRELLQSLFFVDFHVHQHYLGIVSARVVCSGGYCSERLKQDCILKSLIIASLIGSRITHTLTHVFKLFMVENRFGCLVICLV